MQLTKFSDYALRAMMFAASTPDEPVTIERVSETFGISRAHLKKVMNRLSNAGYLETVRGRNGGFRLAVPPAEINLGSVIRLTETGLDCFECNGCHIAGSCRLAGIGGQAMTAFMAVFDGKSLSDILLPPKAFERRE
jgi:Rrf2 family nitric oxide-sensitive transcriptional repressor